MARDVGDDGRLGGPPRLYDSTNLDRGDLYQRVRVPMDPRPEVYLPFGATSLNDSDQEDDLLYGEADESDDLDSAQLREGLSIRKKLDDSGY